MTSLVAVVAGTLALAMGLSLYRVIAGPTIFDRVTGLSVIGTKAIILLLLIGLPSGRIDLFVDISFAYVLISLVAVLTLAKYFERTKATTRG
jgi:multicomponent Na+:H+ antiporter subunit F